MRTRILILLLVALVAAAGWFYVTQLSANSSSAFTLSGTIEATEINLSTTTGGRVKQVYLDEGDPVQKGQALVSLFATGSKMNEKIRSSIDGVVLERLVEPEEMAAPGSTVIVVAPLDLLTVKVYVPEDRYGQISLGQSYPVTVDSFPDTTFQATVRVISDKAEFTPRNVQTTDSRKTTVYAVTLNLEPSAGRLKPGMPADVHFARG